MAVCVEEHDTVALDNEIHDVLTPYGQATVGQIVVCVADAVIFVGVRCRDRRPPVRCRGPLGRGRLVFRKSQFLAVEDSVAVRVGIARMCAELVLLGVRQSVAVGVAGRAIDTEARGCIEIVRGLPSVREAVVVRVGVRRRGAAVAFRVVIQPVSVRVGEDRGSPVVDLDVVVQSVSVRVIFRRICSKLVFAQIREAVRVGVVGGIVLVRIESVFYLPAVGHSIVVAVRIERIGPRVDFVPVQQPVPVAVGVPGACSLGEFVSVRKAIPVRVGPLGIGSSPKAVAKRKWNREAGNVIVCVDQSLAAGMVAEVKPPSVDHAQSRRRVEILVCDELVVVDADREVRDPANNDLERQACIGAARVIEADVVVLDDRASVRRAFGETNIRSEVRPQNEIIPETCDDDVIRLRSDVGRIRIPAGRAVEGENSVRRDEMDASIQIDDDAVVCPPADCHGGAEVR